jgi:site-specific DNA-methyltransferase (adenine-specific)
LGKELLGSLELNRIYQFDCLDGMKLIPDNSVKLTITSPPYNVGSNNIADRAKNKYKNNKDNKKDYYEWLKVRLDEMLRVSETVFFNIQMLAGNKMAIFNLIADYRGVLKDIMIWGKNNPPPQMEQGVMNCGFEFILIFSKNKPDKRKFYDTTFKGNLSNLFMTNVNSKNEWAKKHRATFPQEIPDKLISNFSKENDVILDPFMGIGTTAVSAKNLNRKYIGFEIEPEYIEISNIRLEGV